ncbi:MULTISPECIES: DUF1427 family protein [Stappiaceae]|uniref:DUF1427 family protein n=1 Tax=Stappiaceae TaxID=2821832 RepID=UPI001ADA7743|nr:MULTISPECIES: DUF1427 family protein [unclassified Labrenzia]MBO9421754.1 DUF1427 family protein [Labrenzia sp. R4_2]MBO9423567.1 DUF1427 family protein [Labrenzia sp. R4_1]
MTWQPYVLSLAAGIGIGVIYGLIAVRSPAPPIIALLGLLGMLAGEAAVQWVRGHNDILSNCLHSKSFSVAKSENATAKDVPPSSNT